MDLDLGDVRLANSCRKCSGLPLEDEYSNDHTRRSRLTSESSSTPGLDSRFRGNDDSRGATSAQNFAPHLSGQRKRRPGTLPRSALPTPGQPCPTGELSLSTIVDLHTHTEIGSFDSRTTRADIAQLRDRVPALHGVALTEHQKRWSEEALAEVSTGLLVFNEREYDYHQGHIIVLGAHSLRPWTSVEQLREQVVEAGGLMILAHPFRFYPSGLSLLYPMHEGWHEPGEWPPERLAEHRLFDLVDAVEAWNYRVTPAQNELAEACARARGLPIVAGSDSHAAEDVGRYATEFEEEIQTTEQLISSIRAGRCRPVELTESGVYRPPVRVSEFLLAGR